MAAVKASELVWYHGTGAADAARIATEGSRDIVNQDGWRHLASDLWVALLGLAKSEQDLSRCHRKHEDLINGPALTPLRSAHGQEEGNLFVYGPFFVTLDLGEAYEYAVRNPYRSELLHAIADGLKFLQRCGGAVQTLEDRYPAVFQRIQNPSPPVVLEIGGIEEARLSHQDGRSPVAPAIAQSLELLRQASRTTRPRSFRIDGVKPQDVVAIHDLRDWKPADIQPAPWRPNSDQVQAARKDVSEWLASNRRR